MKIKASSIFYALTLSLIISLYLGGMILFSGVNKRFSSLMEIQETLVNNAHSGVEYGLANYAEIPQNDSLEINLFDGNLDSVTIKKRHWGAFEIINSNAHHSYYSYHRSALGGWSSDGVLPTLYVPDEGRSLSLCGDTRLEGKCFLPKAGLKRAYIEGKNYTGNQMVYGSSFEANKSLPPVEKNFKLQVSDFEGTIMMWEDIDSMSRSFSEEAIHFIHDGVISLENIKLSGHIIVESRDSIFVGATTQLTNVILKSKVVFVERGFKGTAQIFASERIVLEDHVTMEYPSVLGIMEWDKPEEKQTTITIGESSQVVGSVFALSDKPNFRLPVQVNIEKNAEVDGLLYCQGKTQLKGTVKGHLYTQKFYLETSASKYENHLLDAKILSGLPDGFVLAPVFQNDRPLTLMSWLQ